MCGIDGLIDFRFAADADSVRAAAALQKLLELHNSNTRDVHPLLWAALIFTDFCCQISKQNERVASLV